MSVSDYLVFPNVPASVTDSPVWPADISDAQSGYQQALMQGTRPLWKSSLDLGYLDIDEHATLRNFLMAVRMSQTPFLFEHPLEHSQLKAPFGTSTGSRAVWLLKIYFVYGGVTFTYNASMIQLSTLIVYADNAALDSSDYTMNDETGVLTFNSGKIPTAGKALTWSGDYYRKVRLIEWQPYEQNNPAAVSHSMTLQEIM